jgi:hypothetical protein
VNLELIQNIANAVLYEGYMLYPYTASSVKNQQRWNFGVLYPPEFDTSEMQTECLAVTGGHCAVDVRVRFLQCSASEETVEREIATANQSLVELAGAPVRLPFSLLASAALDGMLELRTAELATGLFRITVGIRNQSRIENGGNSPVLREDALLRSMLSTHTILSLHGGEFISLMDPPAEYRDAAADCRNTGTWPVLAGAAGERDAMLSSPIILYDYPQVAPESPGNLFDGTEIDEILTLRILTLSDEEKAEIRGGGERAREVLERSEALPPEQLMKLHGALRSMRPAQK